MKIKERLGKFWKFLKEDSWPSFLVSLVLALIIIKFVFFPLLSLITGTGLPLVIVESCSMYHSMELDQIMANRIYQDYGLDINDTKDWIFRNGFTKGDIIVVVGAKNVKVGDVIIFVAGQTNPIIHRVVNIDSFGKYTTKGDNNLGLLSYEKSISSEQVVGKAVLKVPFLGWVKLIFFDWMKPENQRGFC